MSLKKSDDAVSPVIGVMLMLVITVIIAAVVTAFATGVVTDAEPAPTAVLDVTIDSNMLVLHEETAYYSYAVSGPNFVIRHISGDPIDTKDIELRFSWVHDSVDNNGNPIECVHYSTYSADQFEANNAQGVPGYTSRPQPMYWKTPSAPNGYDYYFGDFIMNSGCEVTASADFLNNPYNGVVSHTGSWFMDAIFDSKKEYENSNGSEDSPGIMAHLPQGTMVNVMMIHAPSNSIIYNKEVCVE